VKYKHNKQFIHAHQINNYLFNPLILQPFPRCFGYSFCKLQRIEAQSR